MRLAERILSETPEEFNKSIKAIIRLQRKYKDKYYKKLSYIIYLQRRWRGIYAPRPRMCEIRKYPVYNYVAPGIAQIIGHYNITPPRFREIRQTARYSFITAPEYKEFYNTNMYLPPRPRNNAILSEAMPPLSKNPDPYKPRADDMDIDYCLKSSGRFDHSMNLPKRKPSWLMPNNTLYLNVIKMGKFS